MFTLSGNKHTQNMGQIILDYSSDGQNDLFIYLFLIYIFFLLKKSFTEK